ncbi:MAG: bifunctional phosphopantothenoylcysteine decarboxylase/phosphopantothenate--cysteine ligase CoaBC [Gammaproteobacteria bacterium]|nr:bifunctional phosphopantothenoylcysteine decarboxylase/phosphopantothenate--cysteine ligase CoaBC [Gammaproteobacteria bacterium]
MNWHENKRVLVGVSGGIAAYKSPALVREFIRRNCDVRVVMTRAAAEFVTPLTLQAVSGHAVRRDLWDAEAEAGGAGGSGDAGGPGDASGSDVPGAPGARGDSGMGHIELARWAELIVVAPASADCIARLAHGRADDLLAAVVLAAADDVEVTVAPAMNRRMWESAATRDNLATLAKRGARIIGPAAGGQACGETGPGRMTEPEYIARELIGEAPPLLLSGAAALVTAGPTWEALDPVRGLTNRSSGKMGFALAQAARDFGARVTLVSGPVALESPPGVRRVDVVSAEEMFEAVMAEAPGADLFIGVAAVADYRPAQAAAHKIAKQGARMRLELTRNPDILAAVAALESGPVTLGFAAETENVVANARAKLEAKGVDVMAANWVGGDDGDGGGDGGDGLGNGGVFGGDANAVTLLFRGRREAEKLARTDKYRLAVQIIERVAPLVTRAGDGDGDDKVAADDNGGDAGDGDKVTAGNNGDAGAHAGAGARHRA